MDAHTLENRIAPAYWLALLAVVALYAVYFLSFTLFDGFATFANDAASYVLIARKWSPFFHPSAAQAFSVPLVTYPPAFPAVLALTGASHSLWAGHLLVSVCMLISLVLLGVYLARQAPPGISLLTLIAVCLMPGLIISSLGILSENLYLLSSLAALTIYPLLRARNKVPWGWNAVLLVLITTALLTRTVGIALVATFLMVPAFDRGLMKRQRVVVPVIALFSTLIWLGWGLVAPRLGTFSYETVTEYTYLAEPHLSQKLLGAFGMVQRNLVELITRWNQYFFLNTFHDWLFLLSYLMLGVCTIAFALRAFRFRLDAIYILFYLGVVCLWPYTIEMVRFLHPILLLLFIQPALYLAERGSLKGGGWPTRVMAGALIVIAAHLAWVQWGLFTLQRNAPEDLPQVAHSYDYYNARWGKYSERLAHQYAFIANAMKLSAEQIPEGDVVAAVKHENYTLLAERKAVVLSTAVPFQQQLCNFLRQGVDTLFISELTNHPNQYDLDLVEEYEPFAREVWPMRSAAGVSKAYVLQLDRPAIEKKLEEEAFDCTEILLQLPPPPRAE